ncbi:MAG: DUF3592 domain-containing protein [Terracidiphilus sp.]
MAGFVLDIFIAFMVRWIIIFWRRGLSRNWPTVSGAVVRSHLEKPGFGCMYVVIEYKYKANWERYHGILNKPYAYATNYAEAYVRHHPAGSELKVRYDPKIPTRSFPIFD